MSDILIDSCVHLEVYEGCCVCESSGYMYGLSNQIIKSANKLIEGYKNHS